MAHTMAARGRLVSTATVPPTAATSSTAARTLVAKPPPSAMSAPAPRTASSRPPPSSSAPAHPFPSREPPPALSPAQLVLRFLSDVRITLFIATVFLSWTIFELRFQTPLLAVPHAALAVAAQAVTSPPRPASCVVADALPGLLVLRVRPADPHTPPFRAPLSAFAPLDTMPPAPASVPATATDVVPPPAAALRPWRRRAPRDVFAHVKPGTVLPCWYDELHPLSRAQPSEPPPATSCTTSDASEERACAITTTAYRTVLTRSAVHARRALHVVLSRFYAASFALMLFQWYERPVLSFALVTTVYMLLSRAREMLEFL